MREHLFIPQFTKYRKLSIETDFLNISIKVLIYYPLISLWIEIEFLDIQI